MAIDHHTLSSGTLILSWIIAFAWVLNIFALGLLGYGMGKYRVTPKLNLIVVLIVAIVLSVAARLVPGYLAWVCAIAGAFNALVAAASTKTLMKEAKEKR